MNTNNTLNVDTTKNLLTSPTTKYPSELSIAKEKLSTKATQLTLEDDCNSNVDTQESPIGSGDCKIVLPDLDDSFDSFEEDNTSFRFLLEKQAFLRKNPFFEEWLTRLLKDNFGEYCHPLKEGDATFGGLRTITASDIVKATTNKVKGFKYERPVVPKPTTKLEIVPEKMNPFLPPHLVRELKAAQKRHIAYSGAPLKLPDWARESLNEPPKSLSVTENQPKGKHYNFYYSNR